MSETANDIRILYVEDDPQGSELLEKLLRLKYPTVSFYTATNGAEGLAAFCAHEPQVVVTDINMPGINGIEMAKEMRRLRPDALLIAVTAYHDGEYVAEAVRVGFTHYITKPVEYRKLLEAIDDCITRSGKRSGPC